MAPRVILEKTSLLSQKNKPGLMMRVRTSGRIWRQQLCLFQEETTLSGPPRKRVLF
jgi:hypothetical protein